MHSSGGSISSDKGGGGGGGGHPDPEIRRGRAPQAPPLDPPLHSYSDIAEI